MTNAASRSRSATEGLAKEKALIEDQLAQSKAERSKLQQEIAAMKREAEQTWAAERVENALLRERINDIAAEIARLTVALEGIDSPIEVMLASEPASANGRARQRRAQSRRGQRRRQGQSRRSHSRAAIEGVTGSRPRTSSLRPLRRLRSMAMMRPRGMASEHGIMAFGWPAIAPRNRIWHGAGLRSAP